MPSVPKSKARPKQGGESSVIVPAFPDDVILSIGGKEWTFDANVHGLIVQRDDADNPDTEDFVVLDPLQRSIMAPGSYSFESLGRAIFRAIELEREQGGKGGGK